MIVIPFKISQSEYSVAVILQDENLKRIREYDPAEVNFPKIHAERNCFSHLRLRDVMIAYATEEEVAELFRMAKEGRTLEALRNLSRGFRYRPDRGDTDGPYRSIATSSEPSTAGEDGSTYAPRNIMDFPEKEKPRDRQRWGPWELQAENLTLCLMRIDIPTYEIDLEKMSDSAKMLDWIFQVQRKTWATDEIVGQLVAALNDLFDPQGNLCSFGKDKTINPTVILGQRIAR